MNPETPTGVLLGRWTPGSPEWLAPRAGRLGGSEIAAVLGLSKWESPFSLWHRKAAMVGEVPQNPEMEAGARFEDAICGKFADNHPEYHVLKAGAFVHVERDWQLANPDRLLYHVDFGVSEMPVGGLEAKFALYDDEWGEEGTDEIPPYYLAQTRWYLDTLGLHECRLQVFIGSSAQWREYVIMVDLDDQAYLREQGRKFLDTVEAGDRPPIDDHNATYQALREMHPDIDDVEVEISADLAVEYQQACADLKTAEKTKRYAVNRLLDAMGNARRAVCAGERVAIRVPGKPDTPPHLTPARTRKDFDS